jgi:hypothetical protein
VRGFDADDQKEASTHHRQTLHDGPQEVRLEQQTLNRSQVRRREPEAIDQPR